MMKLIGTVTSPFVRKVRIVLAEKKIEYEFVQRSPWDKGSEELRTINPLGQVPTLVLDDETVLYDSRVITEYLDSVSPNNRLLPPPGRERIMIKRWEALADGICDAAASAFLEGKRPAKERSPAWITRQKGKITHALGAADTLLGHHPWCNGNNFSLADIALGSALGYLAFRFSELDWPTDHPPLAKIYETLMQRPSFSATVPVA